MRLPRTWPGIHRSAWPQLNAMAEMLEAIYNVTTDATVLIDKTTGDWQMSVPPPQQFRCVILGGTGPYTWAALNTYQGGTYYSQGAADGPSFGWCANQGVQALTGASWSGGTATLTFSGDLTGITGQIVVFGTNPSGYDGTYTIVSAGNGSLTYALTSDPGTYVGGGVVKYANSGATASYPNYEMNGNTNVPVLTVAWTRPRYQQTTGEQEYEFWYQATTNNAQQTTINNATIRLKKLVQLPVNVNLSSGAVVNNYDVSGQTLLEVKPTGDVTVTGLTDSTGPSGSAEEGQMVEISNVGTGTITLPANNSSSSGGDQFSQAMQVPPGQTQAVKLINGKWRPLFSSLPTNTNTGTGGLSEVCGTYGPTVPTTDPTYTLVFNVSSDCWMTGYFTIQVS